MGRRAATKSTVPARERILDAAVQRFSKQSYDATGLRDIAADAEVDVAYVHRCFGSKMQLFAEALHVNFDPVELLDDGGGDLVSALTKGIFRHDGPHAQSAVKPFDIMSQSLSSLEAQDILRDFIANEVIPLFASKIESFDPVRTASLLLAYLAGIVLLRSMIEIEPLRDGSGGWLETSSNRVIKAIITTDVSTTSDP